MRPPLRRVPWTRPPQEFHRPSRRVTPKSHAQAIWDDVAEGRVTRYLPDNLGERWAALCHRSRFWRAVNDIGIFLLMIVAGAVMVWLLFAEAK